MTFPVNHSEVVIYPKTDDAVLNKEAFGMLQFIRLQKSLAVTRTMHLVVTHLNAGTSQRIPVGIITERDIIFIVVAQNRGPFNVTLKDMMSTSIINIDVDKSVERAAAILNKYKINLLPVVHDSSIIGILITGIIMSNVSIEKHAETEF